MSQIKEIEIKPQKPDPIPDPITHYALHYGSSQRPLITVVPDTQWPGMWRIRFAHGSLSDMTNLTRAKDAAEVICAAGRDSALLQWETMCL